MMRRTLARAALLALSASIVLPLGGCVLAAVAAVGVGTYAYVSGELKTTQDVTLDRGWEATKAAMGDLEFTSTDEKKDALQATLKARQADGTIVTIRLKSAPDGKSTEFAVRVGTFGDESKSRQIMDKIKARF